MSFWKFSIPVYGKICFDYELWIYGTYMKCIVINGAYSYKDQLDTLNYEYLSII